MDRFNLRGKHVAGKFEIEAAVGETSHTVTYRATHVQTGRPYTLKVFRVLGEVTSDEREALLQNLIQSAVKIRRAAEDNHVICAAEEMGPLTLPGGQWVPYTAYPEVEGVPLSDVIREEVGFELPPRSLEEVMELLEPVALALTSAHEHGVLHAGLTPSTIYVVGDARSPLVDVRLVDFGVAQAVTKSRLEPGPLSSKSPAQLTMTTTYFDAHFAAPEQVDFTGHAITERTDVYSLALVMAHLLTRTSDDPRLGRDPNYYRATPGGRGVMLAPIVEDAFAAALNRDPGLRPGDVMTFWNMLRGSHRMPAISLTSQTQLMPEPEIQSAGPTTVAVPELAPVQQPSRRPFALAAAAALVLAVGGGAFLLSSPDPAPVEEAPAAETTSVATAEPTPSTKVAAPSCPTNMVQVAAGQFFMGSDEHDALDFEKPAHNVKLSTYCIDRNEVTVAQYKACSDEGKCKRASKVNVWLDIDEPQRRAFDPLCNMNDPEGKADHPVNCVTWRMAHDFCGEHDKRLPTEAEWEFAARGKDGRIYPWGDETPTAKHLNGCGSECAAWGATSGQNVSAMHDEDDGHPHTAPVGSYPAGSSQFGLNDVVGNVWEWVGDWYMPYTNEALENPTGPERTEKRVIRGGSWNAGHKAWVRPTFRYRDFPDTKSYGIGFRCAKSLTETR